MLPTLTSLHRFPIVGIGASSGGLHALQNLFLATDSQCDMAFVVVVHLSPTHESKAASILGATTAMPVVEVTGPVHIEKNTVYIVAPDRHVEMVDGYLRANKKLDSAGWPITIDLFLKTLSAAHGPRAVGAILSGNGTDGVAGLSAIKEKGGVAIVQHPDEAEYPGMPRAAIEAGVADFVLPVAEMPLRLARIRDITREISLPEAATLEEDPQRADSDRLDPGAEDIIREILAILHTRTGHDFAKYKRATVLRRLARRMQVRETTTLASYRDLMREDRAESDALLRDMLIGVTEFFRDRDAFDVIEREVVPQLFEAAKKEVPLRIWSAGCSTGEETYSLAMLFAEYANKSGNNTNFQVFGSDIDEHAIRVARAGVFGAPMVPELQQSRLIEHFYEEDGQYRIKKALRDKILFANQNVLRDPPFSRIDFISCRNLLIYLNRETHAQVLEMFHFALNPGGILFLGSSESADIVPDLFVPIDKRNRIYRAREASRLPRTAISLSPPMLSEPLVEVRRRPLLDKRSFANVHERILLGHAPPSVLVDQQFAIVHMAEGVSQFLRHVSGGVTSNLLELVQPELRQELRAALFQANQSGKIVETHSVRHAWAGKNYFVTMVARPVYDAITATDFISVQFHKAELTTDEQEPAIAALPENEVLSSLEHELQRMRAEMQDMLEDSETSNEELKAANEELQAINEELRSATEELETSKEELQSINEELTTVNFELRNKIEETSKANDDLQNLIASTDLATIFVDRGVRIKRYTPQACALFNLIAGDIGRPLNDITHKLHYPELAADIAKTFTLLRPVEREVAGEECRWYIARLVPYRTGHDQIDGTVMTFIDITSRRQAEERVRASEERIRLVAASTKDYAIITSDLDGAITSFNSGAERMFGYREEEVLGQNHELIFTPEDRAAGVPEQERRLARDMGRSEDERWHLRKDGSRFFCSGVTTPLGDGVPTGFAKIGRDLTGRQEVERQRTEQLQQEQSRSSQARHDNEQKDRFLAIMSHELKHPLNLIHMNADLLLRAPAIRSAPGLHRSVSAIRSSTMAQAKIINDLLDMSRLSTGKLKLSCEDVELGVLVQATVDAMGAPPGSPAIALQFERNASLHVHADVVRLEQVVWNLLNNAIKFTPADGAIFVSISADQERVHLSVRDTGQGIRGDVLPVVFDMFEQGTARAMNGTTGLGIGLALVRELVELHGGQIKAESPGPGKGATFTVSLPYASPNARDALQQQMQASALHGLRILLIDDNEDVLTLFTMLLESEGANVTTSQSAREALDLLAEGDFGLVISDLTMPDMDGYDFIRAMRAQENSRLVPALAVSGISRSQDIDRAIQAGFSAHVSKPVDIEVLAEVVGKLVSRTHE